MSQIDLHTHSTASDGSLPPEALVREAAGCGLRALAVTDHDTTQGLPEAMAAGRRVGVEVIPGVELSVNFTPGFMHILGLWLPERPKRLQERLEYLQRCRRERNQKIIAALRDLNIELDEQEVKDLAGEGVVGRVHIAMLLVHKQVVPDLEQAIARYVGSRGLAYVPKEKLEPAEAVSLLHAEGATVILAHPYSVDLPPDGLEEAIRELKESGLDGVEALYSEHSPEQTALYLSLCRKFDLAVSGGSDFHGLGRPGVSLGTGRGNLRLSAELLQVMKHRRRARGLWVTSAVAP